MALPIVQHNLKTRYLTATSSSSNGFMSVTVPGRSRLVQVFYATTLLTAHTAATNAVDITVNGTTATGMGGLVVTTSTGNSATNLGGPSSPVYLNAGDVLATWLSSCTGGTSTYVTLVY